MVPYGCLYCMYTLPWLDKQQLVCRAEEVRRHTGDGRYSVHSLIKGNYGKTGKMKVTPFEMFLCKQESIY